jgi:hypothetical protein
MNEFFDQIHQGRPLKGVSIIDMHAHLGPYYNMHTPDSSAAFMLRAMDSCGIGKTVFSPSFGFDADIAAGNDLMLKTVDKHPGRLYGAVSVNGNYPELSIDELRRSFENPRVVMVKIHPWGAKCKLSDRRMKGIYDFASARKLFALVHTWLDGDPYGSQDLFASVAKDHPDIKWIMGHSGGPYGSRHAVELALEVPNIFLDITLSMAPARQIEFFVKEVGSERVLFGTDNPFLDPRPQVGRVGLAEITREEKINIFYANALRHIKFV